MVSCALNFRERRIGRSCKRSREPKACQIGPGFPVYSSLADLFITVKRVDGEESKRRQRTAEEKWQPEAIIAQLTSSRVISSISPRIRLPTATSISSYAQLGSSIMSPPCHSFLASELPTKVQEDTRGKRRKLGAGTQRVDLSACELFGMFQYKCEVQRPLTRESKVQCFAVDRLFRR